MTLQEYIEKFDVIKYPNNDTFFTYYPRYKIYIAKLKYDDIYLEYEIYDKSVNVYNGNFKIHAYTLDDNGDYQGIFLDMLSDNIKHDIYNNINNFWLNEYIKIKE